MGVYINMEMPKVCACCPFMIDGGIDMSFCAPLRKIVKNQMTLSPNCPLVHVPPHGRLIDADALFDFILNIYKTAQGDARKAYRDVLDTIVAAGDVIPADEEVDE